MLLSCMKLSSLPKTCSPDFQSAKDYQRTRCSTRITRYYQESESMQTTTVAMREFCSRLGACGVKGPFTRNSKKSLQEWELRSNSTTKMKRRTNTATQRTRSIASRFKPLIIRPHKTRMRIHVNIEDVIPRARPGMLEMIYYRKLENDATQSHRLPRPRTDLRVSNTFSRSPFRPNNNFHSEQPIFKIKKKTARSNTLEPG